MITGLWLTPLLLCWGSFLNVVAYRLVSDIPFFAPRSICPHCKSMIAWYDNIPVISWVILRGRCRSCNNTISSLYPFIEILTALIGNTLVYTVSSNYWFAYGLFFSALIVTIRTDLETFLISRYVTVFLIPLGLIFSYVGLLPISHIESMLGALTAYFFLILVRFVHFKLTGLIGLGQGDIDLLSFIGSFIGVFGWWMGLLIASTLGSIVGILYALTSNTSLRTVKIPFGPFLALGAILFVLFKPIFTRFLFF